MDPTRAVVFDLDGTLVQTRIASWEIFEQVNRRHGLGVDSPEEFFALFRGNIFASLAERCRDDAHAEEVKQEFLTLLRRDYSPPLVPGMRDVVRRLASECTLAVMSSNAMAVLRRVLVDNDIAYCFAHVFGGDVAPDKRAAIRAFLDDAGSGFGRRCAADYDEGNRRLSPGPSSTVLVTDTAGDVRDAREVGIRVIGVAWGMHSADELTEAGAEFVALWPQEVGAYLLGDDATGPPTKACATGSCAAPPASSVSLSSAPASPGPSPQGPSPGPVHRAPVSSALPADASADGGERRDGGGDASPRHGGRTVTGRCAVRTGPPGFAPRASTRRPGGSLAEADPADRSLAELLAAVRPDLRPAT